MRPDGVQTLRGVHAFLREVVLPGVEQQHRSETRAALKLLESAAAELDVLSGVLIHETRALRVLLGRVDELLGTTIQVTDDRLSPGHGLERLHGEHDRARSAATQAIVALQTALRVDGVPAHPEARQLLGDVLRALGEHATTRLPWQSVFSANAIPEELPDVQHRQ